MKRVVILLLLISGFSFSQDKNLEDLITKLDDLTTETHWKDVAGKLQRIADKESDSWIANYYTAYAFTELANHSVKDKKDQLCDKADLYLNKAMKLKGDNVEEFVLKAHILSARIKVNAMFRGASMGKESKEYLNKALALNPDHSRANLVRAIGIYNTPSLFGGGEKKAKPYYDKAVSAFAKETVSKKNIVKWGKAHLQELTKKYKK